MGDKLDWLEESAIDNQQIVMMFFYKHICNNKYSIDI